MYERVLNYMVGSLISSRRPMFRTPCFWSKQRGGYRVQTDETARYTGPTYPTQPWLSLCALFISAMDILLKWQFEIL
jgi:hypothetical protein